MSGWVNFSWTIEAQSLHDLVSGQKRVGEGCPSWMILELLLGEAHKPIEIFDVGDYLTASRPLVDLGAGTAIAGVVNVDAEKPAVNLAFVGVDHTIAIIITPHIHRTVPLAQCEVLAAV